MGSIIVEQAAKHKKTVAITAALTIFIGAIFIGPVLI
jgi:hypothetical protein